uniref:HaPE645 alpha-2 subunit n=1 Tax=Hemiselmis andersenii TaxID=464988 RepID=UPI00293DA1C8|nr:Chain C, HaPE645 alpha-2 subunit [Hemiselmis andersenii]7SUT_G Chain G, HaPE645 alpha-2 subunit [Hemiselmis andersenii]
KTDNKLRAPIITVFDARGCREHKNREYKGPKTGTQDDEMCVKVQYEKIAACEDTAFIVLKECLSEMKS